MLSVGWLVLAVLLAMLLTTWVTFTLTRLDRLHARVDAAQAAMDAQLVRRAAALQYVAESPDSGVPGQLRPGYDTIARAALRHGSPAALGDDDERQDAENAVGRAVAALGDSPAPVRADAAAELHEAAARVLIARRFYNDAVRDTRALRARRMPRLLHLAGHRRLPEFFDIDDTLPVPQRAGPADAPDPAVAAPVASSPGAATRPPDAATNATGDRA